MNEDIPTTEISDIADEIAKTILDRCKDEVATWDDLFMVLTTIEKCTERYLRKLERSVKRTLTELGIDYNKVKGMRKEDLVQQVYEDLDWLIEEDEDLLKLAEQEENGG